MKYGSPPTKVCTDIIKTKGIVKQYMHTPDNPHSLSQNFLTCLAITNDKQLLVASLKGINIYNPIKGQF